MAQKPFVKKLAISVALMLIISTFLPADRIPVASAAHGKPPQHNDSANSGPLTTFTPPSNDNFANATIISAVPFVVTGLDTTGATTQAGDPPTPTSCGSPDDSSAVAQRLV